MEAQIPTARGLTFQDTKLYSVSDDRVVVLTGWPDLGAWMHNANDACSPNEAEEFADLFLGTHSYGFLKERSPYAMVIADDGPLWVWYDDQYLLPFTATTGFCAGHNDPWREHTAINAFWGTFPKEVLVELQKYRFGQWRLACLFASCPAALDLSRSNPALAHALAHYMKFRTPPPDGPREALRGLLTRKQVEILRWLNFPATESVRRILARIDLHSIDGFTLSELRQMLHDPATAKCLSHLTRISTEIVLLLKPGLKEFVTPSLLIEVSRAEQQSWNCVELLRDVVKMAKTLRRPCRYRFRSMARLQTIHDELTKRYVAEQASGRHPVPQVFPPPPFAGTPFIQPIPTPEDLLREGKEMEHCVATHAESVAPGNEYVYRVTAPIRATIAVYLVGDQWEVYDCKMAGNGLVDDTTIKQIMTRLLLSGVWKPQVTSWADEAEPFHLPAQLPLLVVDAQMPLLVPEDMQIFRHLLRGFAA